MKPIIVLHETLSTAADTIAAIQNPSNTFSYHVVITRLGELVYLVPANQLARGAANSAFNGEQVNNSVDSFAYHIALESPLDVVESEDSHSGYTESQYMSLAWLCSKTGIDLNRITTHKEVDLAKVSKDPRSFNRVKFEKTFNSFPKTKYIMFGIE